MYTHLLYTSTYRWCVNYTFIGVYACTHTHVHIADQMFTTNPQAHYTDSSRGNKVGLLQQITKNKNSHLQWLRSFLYVHKEWIVIKKKGTVLAMEENWAKPSWSKWECSNVLYHFISYFFYSWWFDFTFWLLKTFQTQVNKTTTVQALFSRKMSEISKPLACLRTTMCKPELSQRLK